MKQAAVAKGKYVRDIPIRWYDGSHSGTEADRRGAGTTISRDPEYHLEPLGAESDEVKGQAHGKEVILMVEGVKRVTEKDPPDSGG